MLARRLVTMHQPIVLYSDGASRGNPGRGPAAIGYMICDTKGAVLAEHAKYIGDATNNEAEYRALIAGLDAACGISRGELECCTDSELVVRHMNGVYRLKDPRMKAFFLQVSALKSPFEKVTFKHLPRTNPMIMKVDKKVEDVLTEQGFPKRSVPRKFSFPQPSPTPSQQPSQSSAPRFPRESALECA